VQALAMCVGKRKTKASTVIDTQGEKREKGMLTFCYISGWKVNEGEEKQFINPAEAITPHRGNSRSSLMLGGAKRGGGVASTQASGKRVKRGGGVGKL